MVSYIIGLPIGVILSTAYHKSRGNKVGIKVEQHLDKLAQEWLKSGV